MLDPSLVILLWIPIATLLFAFLRPARALIIAYLVAATCLPVGTIPVEGFFDIDKQRATAAAVLLGLVVFRTRELGYYRFCWADLWFALFCGGAILSSVSNGLGLYEGVSHAGARAIDFGTPYIAGRLCIRTKRDLYDVGRAVCIAAVIYALPAVWEWRMSPQLHTRLYGYVQHAFGQFHRWGFFRPIVCMRHALDLGMFFSIATLLSIWLWRVRQLRSFHGLPPYTLIAASFIGLLTCMSLGPWGLLMFWDKLRSRFVMLFPVLLAFAWMGARFQGSIHEQSLKQSVDLIATVAPDRAKALEYRLNSGSDVINSARQRTWLGWGRLGGGRPTDQTDNRRWQPIDGLWLIVLGTTGVFGLASFYLWWCWPVFQHLRLSRSAGEGWATLGFVVVVSVYAIFYLFNGFPNIIVIAAMGGVTGVQRCRTPSHGFHRSRDAGWSQCDASSPRAASPGLRDSKAGAAHVGT